MKLSLPRLFKVDISFYLLRSLFYLLALTLLSCSNQKLENTHSPMTQTIALQQVAQVADQYVDTKQKYQPLAIYAAGLVLNSHDGFANNSSQGIIDQRNIEDQLYRQLKNIDEALIRGKPAWCTHGMLMEVLEASIEARVCRQELWNIDFMGAGI